MLQKKKREMPKFKEVRELGSEKTRRKYMLTVSEHILDKAGH
jgi:hypothetical protein